MRDKNIFTLCATRKVNFKGTPSKTTHIGVCMSRYMDLSPWNRSAGSSYKIFRVSIFVAILDTLEQSEVTITFSRSRKKTLEF